VRHVASTCAGPTLSVKIVVAKNTGTNQSIAGSPRTNQ
jgi:hypothetical protein